MDPKSSIPANLFRPHVIPSVVVFCISVVTFCIHLLYKGMFEMSEWGLRRRKDAQRAMKLVHLDQLQGLAARTASSLGNDIASTFSNGLPQQLDALHADKARHLAEGGKGEVLPKFSEALKQGIIMNEDDDYLLDEQEDLQELEESFMEKVSEKWRALEEARPEHDPSGYADLQASCFPFKDTMQAMRVYDAVKNPVSHASMNLTTHASDKARCYQEAEEQAAKAALNSGASTHENPLSDETKGESQLDVEALGERAVQVQRELVAAQEALGTKVASDGIENVQEIAAMHEDITSLTEELDTLRAEWQQRQLPPIDPTHATKKRSTEQTVDSSTLDAALDEVSMFILQTHAQGNWPEFDELHTNDEGLVTVEEFLVCSNARGIELDQKRVMEVFSRMNSDRLKPTGDHDDKVSREEYEMTLADVVAKHAVSGASSDVKDSGGKEDKAAAKAAKADAKQKAKEEAKAAKAKAKEEAAAAKARAKEEAAATKAASTSADAAPQSDLAASPEPAPESAQATPHATPSAEEVRDKDGAATSNATSLVEEEKVTDKVPESLGATESLPELESEPEPAPAMPEGVVKAKDNRATTGVAPGNPAQSSPRTFFRSFDSSGEEDNAE